ncbi:ABC transporter substrate-binding protein [Sporosarcina sp. E16_3]|uniref:ABC transporter substrate-binding protein n=1 Tax=Sporosarcina sp. E16_3 TaxID=2789293 RepID=UPI001A9208D8|nr:ABC transporter substrate-binding protein [Sporosarcina sp. E16_3]MBO0603138.1 ABC transporter substrate-binding protein [Sporosarcina sp. E16_3]
MGTKQIAYKLLIIMLLSLVLVACTNNQSSKNDAKIEEATSKGDAVQKEPSTRLFTDAMGRKVELPANPERIIAHFYASEMIAINQPIIGTNFINATEVLTEAQLKGIEDIGGDGVAPNLEKTLALNPDLIIVPNFLEASDLDELSKIAPTVAIDYSSDVISRLKTLGEIIGKPENAEKWITDYTAKAEEKRDEVKPLIAPGETASAFIIYEGKQLYVYGPQRLGPIMYDALGFIMPPKVEEMFLDKKDSLWEMISLEVLPEFAGDRIFLIASDDSEESKQMIEEVINGPIWKGIPAVRNGKAYVVESRWAFNDPLTLDWLLDEMPKTISR